MAGNSSGLPGAVSDLGLGGDLSSQVQNETDEQRKKRLAQMQQNQLLGPAGSMAVTSLLGMGGQKSAGY